MPVKSKHIPQFVYKYGRSLSAGELKRFEQRLAYPLLRDNYQEFLKKYNTLYLFRWSHDDWTLDRRYFWHRFLKKIGETDVDHHSSNRVHIKAIQEATGIPLGVDQNDNLRYLFKHNKDIRDVNSSVEKVLATAPKNHLELLSVGTKLSDLNGTASSTALLGANYIKPLVEESLSMYQDLDYDKLLQLARNTKNESPTGPKQVAKQLLRNVTSGQLTRPAMSKSRDWLFFTNPSPYTVAKYVDT
ncbi:Cbt1p KNAG_0G00200 [Huiozyma naganishii CBS 8797]|uniref:Uncharacterized protein n=1 Tax=Huiozyma naganishii (strain ATCC MYA-139 / BCRC 22969 / CBS 8797 / KCTC 17520 / NBRC 10181 / NCYC 3082 / Yp74L-3) TaxID=1071383 RepID=J7RNF7_HUIN7|nr:hypothetical protein KNAG_0G00200 [Kazachstania naganishii CBS 8797]CCK71078.1 hypothetical protein KNAG_0G00200 [Kazachstania naganishii CBS 8797]